VDGYAEKTQRLHDFPIFSGKYSTYSYLEETVRAFEDMSQKLGVSALDALRGAESIFLHRPYHHMPVQAVATLYLRALVESSPENPTVLGLCREAGVSREALEAELGTRPDLFGRVLAGQADADPFPLTTQITGALRKSDEFKAFLESKMSLGASGASNLGNLYTAALPAWMAAGFEEALGSRRDLSEKHILTIGYGSGDAAEALPARVVPGWADAAKNIGFAAALEPALDLTRDQYESLHDTGRADGLPPLPGGRFRISRVGDRYDPAFQDLAIDYFEYAP